MRYLMWLLKAAIFFALFAFALNNQEPVTLRLFFGASWQAPMVLVLLCVLVLGVVMGVAVMLPLWLKARSTRTRGSKASSEPDTPSTLTPVPPDAPRHGS